MLNVTFVYKFCSQDSSLDQPDKSSLKTASQPQAATQLYISCKTLDAHPKHETGGRPPFPRSFIVLKSFFRKNQAFWSLISFESVLTCRGATRCPRTWISLLENVRYQEQNCCLLIDRFSQSVQAPNHVEIFPDRLSVVLPLVPVKSAVNSCADWSIGMKNVNRPMERLKRLKPRYDMLFSGGLAVQPAGCQQHFVFFTFMCLWSLLADLDQF